VTRLQFNCRHCHFESDQFQAQSFIAQHYFPDKRSLNPIGLDDNERAFFFVVIIHAEIVPQFFGCGIIMYMSSITIPKQEYQRLKRQSAAYRAVAAGRFAYIVRDDVETVMKDFEKTGLYSKKFLADLEKGLRRSSVYRKA